MSEPVPAGRWVEINRVVLPPGRRAPQVPADTAKVPLEMRVKGFLISPAALGATAEIRTLAGRRLKGTLCDASPAYRHNFGEPIAELLDIIEEVRK